MPELDANSFFIPLSFSPEISEEKRGNVEPIIDKEIPPFVLLKEMSKEKQYAIFSHWIEGKVLETTSYAGSVPERGTFIGLYLNANYEIPKILPSCDWSQFPDRFDHIYVTQDKKVNLCEGRPTPAMLKNTKGFYLTIEISWLTSVSIGNCIGEDSIVKRPDDI